MANECKAAQTAPTLHMMDEMPEAAQDALINIAQGIIMGYELAKKEATSNERD